MRSPRTENLGQPILPALRARFDYILLDTAPSATPATIAAYRSADWMLLTTLPEPLSVEGLEEAIEDVADAQQHMNPNLRRAVRLAAA
jgi:cellulose biosynthesis protein BcsQ